MYAYIVKPSERKNMIIGACGFGSSGSSAVSDYLKEFDCCHVLDKVEFDWVSIVDGLIDLEYHLKNPHNRTSDSFCAIERFRECAIRRSQSFLRAGISQADFLDSVDRFITAITTTSWEARKKPADNIFEKLWLRIIARTRYIEKWELKHKQQWSGYPFVEVPFAVNPEGFDDAAKKQVREVLAMMGATFDKPIILDQPFAGNNPQACFKFYDDPYAIVVDRDPRDIYVFANTRLVGRTPHFMPIQPVEKYVAYFKALRDEQPYKEQNERILRVRFEDMVYHYDETTEIIRHFLNFPENPTPKSIFDPAISMPNTQVWKRFPQFKDDISLIEEQLSDYLFDFSGCPEPDLNGVMFHGKSPKNL